MREVFMVTGLFFFMSSLGLAQQVDYNKIVLPNDIKVDDFGEKLVRLEWNNHPDNVVVRNTITISKQELKISKRDWMNKFHLAGNLNEFNIDASRDLANRSQFFPRYNFSLSIPLGHLFTNPLNNKIAAIEIENAESKLKTTKLELRKNVLQAYNDYLMYDEIYKIQTIALSDAEANHNIIEEAFKIGEETYDKYTASLGNINQRKISKLQAANNLRNAKLLVESYIGMELENVE